MKNPNDRIIIKDLCVECIVGVLPHERKNPQPLILTIKLQTNLQIAAKSKNLSDTIDYFDLANKAVKIVKEGKFHLLETLAEELAKFILKNKLVRTVSLEIQKPKAIPEAKFAAISIERSQEDE